MQSKIIALAFAVTAVTAKGRAYPFCPFNSAPACCQSVDGSASYYDGNDCTLVGNAKSRNGLYKRCAATGRTAYCCQRVVGSQGQGCAEV